MRTKLETVRKKAMVCDGKLADVLYEYELAEHIDYWYDGLQADQDEFVVRQYLTKISPIESIIFESERLQCRRWQPTDLATLLLVYGDAEAMRWVGDGAPISQADGEAWLKVTENNYRTRGYGMFAIEDRTSGQVII